MKKQGFDKNLIIAAVLSISVIIIFNLIFPPKQQKPQEQQAVATNEAAEQSVTKAPDSSAGVSKETPAPAAEVPETAGFEKYKETDIPVETDYISAVISTRGGVIKSWKLKKYKDEEGKPLELVHTGNAAMPTLVVPGGMDVNQSSRITYSADSDGLVIDDNNKAGTITLTASGGGGLIKKVCTFNNSSYGLELDISVQGFEDFSVITGEGFGMVREPGQRAYGHVGYIAYTAEGLIKEKTKNVKEDGPVEIAGDKGWAGLTDMYFMAVMVSEEGFRAELEPGESDWGYVQFDSSGSGKYIMYAGPKEYDELKELGYGLEQSVDFGWFAFLAKPLFYVLKFFYGLVGNYGWAIIIMTVIIKLLFAPLTHKQQKSMKRMQKLQPLMTQLKEKHKGDSQKLNAEMMELYKKHKVNPLGGCLPMLIQLPVFIALYKVLYVAIELRRAPFMWWLTDLSAKDPYYVLPILMGVSMFLMQKMTPTTVEGPQAKMFKFLPVIMVVIFINLPSGLLLYFTVSNLLQMGQQFYINKFSPDEA